MAEFLTTSGISYYIEQIILGAQQEFVLLSPYLSISDNLVRRLYDADKKGVKSIIVYRKNKLKKGERKILSGLENLSLYYSSNLHAKCYFNRRFMIITSMNIYAFSEQNNREMGVLLDLRRDRKLFIPAQQEALSILNSATQQEISVKQELRSEPEEKEQETIETPQNKQQVAFCIRCRTDIQPNIFRPLCSKCYVSWARYKNKNYREKYCHECGKERPTTVLIPRCKDCIQT